MTDQTSSKRRGPEPDRVKIDVSDWADAVAAALRKPAPQRQNKAKRKRPKAKR